MSIRVLCPNGHDLKIKEKYAGVMGVCPVCRVPIKVPDPEDVFDEDSIMDVLEPHESGLSGLSLKVSDVEKPEPSDAGALKGNAGETKKKCARCRKRVPGAAHICPFCHNYVPPLQWSS